MCRYSIEICFCCLTGHKVSCHAFADPYVEHDTLTLWLDLILLKRDVYRHLLYNRGLGARRLSDQGPRRGNHSTVTSSVEEITKGVVNETQRVADLLPTTPSRETVRAWFLY